MIEIIEYTEEYHADFKRLNMEWLEKYQLTESHDLQILDNPTETILNRGGFIWLARSVSEIIGTAAICRTDEKTVELVKMCVTENFRGKGIGKKLLEICISQAKTTGAGKMILYSNHQLETALAMYSSFGFVHVDAADSPFVTADIKMELTL